MRKATKENQLNDDDLAKATPGHIRLNGYLWRCTDPDIPEVLRKQLVYALMQARQEVGTARKENNLCKEQYARSQVQISKVALRERGPK